MRDNNDRFVESRHPFADRAVEAAFASFPEQARTGLLALRELIFDTARKTAGVGAIQETLKWGQPAYLTPETQSGSTIRLGVPKDGGFAIYVHCQTTLIDDFRREFPDDFVFEGNRAVRFLEGSTLNLGKLEELVRRALIYHLRRR